MADFAHARKLDATIKPKKGSFQMTQGKIQQFLCSLKERGCAVDTIKSYRQNLQRFFRDLPDDKIVYPFTASRWREGLIEEGYQPATVNQRLSTVNSFLEYIGLREYQAIRQLDVSCSVQPEITRNEYLRLLSAAKLQNKERTYMLVKVFATLGISIQALPDITVEAIYNGRVILPTGKTTHYMITLPRVLQKELIFFIKRNQIQNGPIFLSGSGKCLNRSMITKCIQGLAGDAQVAPEKCNPRCLRKLYQTTRHGIENSFAQLCEQTYERLLETEQLTVGWEEV